MGRGLVIGLLVLAATTTGLLGRPAQASTSREDHMRAEIAQLLNGERAGRGLGQLPIDAALSPRAQAWSEHNRSTGCFPPTDCHSPDAEGEILAWGGPDSKTGAVVVAWMQSTIHRDILLHPKALAMGVGFSCSADGVVTATVQFGGVSRPVPATEESPIATERAQGSACTGPAAYLAATAPPSTTNTTGRAPATTAPPRPAPEAPVVIRRTPSPTLPAVTEAPPTAPSPSPSSTVTAPASVVLSAESPGVMADIDDVAVAAPVLPPPHRAESSWLFMIVVVVFLSVLRVGFQLRDIAAARAKERTDGLGL